MVIVICIPARGRNRLRAASCGCTEVEKALRGVNVWSELAGCPGDNNISV
jgi:hypothetical protein